jgi:para-nitrobenzyl esterase
MIVDTTAGKVQGLEKHGVLQFRGIPYGRAERFGPVEPPEPWTGVRDATAFAPTAPQNASALERMLGAQGEPGQEDCLAVNVYTPAADDTARPTMVWIHGGGFVSGSGHVPWYNGSSLAQRYDVVVVTLNYRLGALGFLHLGHLDPAYAASGTNGIGDQIQALRWVHDNIARFGGDPTNVTIFGESAGGMSVGTLLAAPTAQGLFHKAIAQSGAASHTHDTATAAAVTERFLALLDLPPDGGEALLTRPVDDILQAQAALEAERQAAKAPARLGLGRLTFQPVVDGALLPGPPLDAIAAGSAAGIGLVAGTTAHEWNLFHAQDQANGSLTEEHLGRRLARLVGADRVGDVLDAYRAARPGLDLDGLYCAVMTDRVFRIPAVRLAEAQIPHAPRVSMYRFDRPSTAFGGTLGACHAIEVPFAFANLDRGGADMLVGSIEEPTRRLADRMSRAWATAARTGSPEHDDLPWPAYDTDRKATCVLDHETSIADDPDGELRRLWDELP